MTEEVVSSAEVPAPEQPVTATVAPEVQAPESTTPEAAPKTFTQRNWTQRSANGLQESNASGNASKRNVRKPPPLLLNP